MSPVGPAGPVLAADPPDRRVQRLEVPLRILHVTKRFPGAAGGDATAVARLRQEQESRGHHVDVVTSRSDGIVAGEGVHRVGLDLAPEQLDSVGVRRVLSLVLLAGWAVRALPRLRPDVLHVHSVDMGAALAPAALLHGVPRMITLHGTSIGDDRFSRRRRVAETALVRVAGYRRVTSVDATVVPGLPDGALGVATFLPNPVDTVDPVHSAAAPAVPAPRAGFVAPGAVVAGPGAGGRILFAGRLEDVKGLDVLLAALPAVLRGVPRAHLTVVGGGSREADLRAAVTAAGLDGHVRFLGRADREEVLSLMDEADVLAVPSRHEGLPMVLLEAWARRLPVVVTAVGSVPVVADDGHDALLVPREDPAALAAALVRVITDSVLADRLSRNGFRTAVDSFQPDRVHREVLALYRSCLSSAARPGTGGRAWSRVLDRGPAPCRPGSRSAGSRHEGLVHAAPVPVGPESGRTTP